MRSRFLVTSFKLQAAFLSLIILLFALISTEPVFAADGAWTNKQYKINGGWTLERKDGQNIIRFDENFKTKGGPDLKVFLSTHTIDNANGKNATDGSVLIGVLKSNKGAQEYVIPDNVDLASFQSLLIHCEQYSVLWGGASIH